jgi:hypothetical protein
VCALSGLPAAAGTRCPAAGTVLLACVPARGHTDPRVRIAVLIEAKLLEEARQRAAGLTVPPGILQWRSALGNGHVFLPGGDVKSEMSTRRHKVISCRHDYTISCHRFPVFPPWIGRVTQSHPNQ